MAGLGASIAQAALEAWVDCSPQGYVIEERCLPALLATIAARVPNRSPGARAEELGEMFSKSRKGDPPLFLKLVKPENGKVHFLYFWKAFGEAARVAGSGPGEISRDNSLSSELEILRDRMLRHIEEGSALGAQGGSSSSLASVPGPIANQAIPTLVLVEEVHRAASMSAHPHFWQSAATSLAEQMKLERLTAEELTSILLSWLHDSALWETELQQENALTRSRSTTRSPEAQELPAKRRGLQVRLHVYDVSQEEGIQRLNRFLAHKSSPLKLGGVFHAGVEVNGLEWSFGFSASETRPGVSCVEPKTHPQHHYRQTVELPLTKLSPEEIADIISEMIEEYPGDDYDLLRRNCCHFADDFSRRLGVGGIPGWVHRLARFGATVDSLLQNAPQPIKDRIYGIMDQ